LIMDSTKTSWNALSPVIVNPRQWKKFLPHIRLYVINVFKYGNFSTNVNSRKYWNKKLSSKVGGRWRVQPYRHVFKYFPRDEEFSVLDIGSALGDGPIFIQETYPKAKVSGLEFSDTGIEIARRKSDVIHWHHLDILKDSIPKVYDYVIIVHTLEHFDDPLFVVNKCLRAARGSLIINVPYDEDTDRKMFGVTEHRYFFDKTTFEKFYCRSIEIVDDGKSIIYEIRV